MSEDTGKQRQKDKRDRPATERAILEAFEKVMLRDGFRGLGVNAVATEAGVNKVLIYRYFGDFPGLAKTWAETSTIWPSALELIGNDPEAFAKLDVRKRIKSVLGNYMEGIRERPLTVELQAAELCFPSEVSRTLELAVKKPGLEVNDYIRLSDAGDEFESLAAKTGDLVMVVNALTAYFTIRERNNPDYLDLHLNDDTWKHLRGLVDDIIEKYLAD